MSSAAFKFELGSRPPGLRASPDSLLGGAWPEPVSEFSHARHCSLPSFTTTSSCPVEEFGPELGLGGQSDSLNGPVLHLSREHPPASGQTPGGTALEGGFSYPHPSCSLSRLPTPQPLGEVRPGAPEAENSGEFPCPSRSASLRSSTASDGTLGEDAADYLTRHLKRKSPTRCLEREFEGCAHQATEQGEEEEVQRQAGGKGSGDPGQAGDDSTSNPGSKSSDPLPALQTCSPASDMDEVGIILSDSAVASLQQRCLRLLAERAEALSASYAEATRAIQLSTELDAARRAQERLAERLGAAEEELLTHWQGDGPEGLLAALAHAKVVAAEAEFRVLDMRGALRQRHAEVRRLRRLLGDRVPRLSHQSDPEDEDEEGEAGEDCEQDAGELAGRAAMAHARAWDAAWHQRAALEAADAASDNPTRPVSANPARPSPDGPTRPSPDGPTRPPPAVPRPSARLAALARPASARASPRRRTVTEEERSRRAHRWLDQAAYLGEGSDLGSGAWSSDEAGDGSAPSRSSCEEAADALSSRGAWAGAQGGRKAGRALAKMFDSGLSVSEDAASPLSVLDNGRLAA